MQMHLEDVAGSSGGYTALFTRFDEPRLTVELKCTQEQANQLLKRTDNNYFQTYAFVARLDNVARPKFSVNGIGGGEDSSVELDDSAHVSFAQGELLEAIQLP